MCNTEIGLGSTPQEAYQDWRHENVGRRIDLGRYAGYGGARPDKEIVTYVGWWLAVWERLKFIAAVAVPAGLAISGIVSWLGGGNG